MDSTEENQKLVEEIKRLGDERDALEKEAASITAFLTSPGMPGISGGLIDEEGFPRAELDHYKIREARNRLACLNTDYDTIMKKIEEKLKVLHSQSRVAVPIASKDNKEKNTGHPFAKIDTVEPSSPAATAGLKINDLVIEFGAIRCVDQDQKHNCFKRIPEEIKEGWKVPMKIKRGSEFILLHIVPSKAWNGNGLLGCKVSPMPSE